MATARRPDNKLCFVSKQSRKRRATSLLLSPLNTQGAQRLPAALFCHLAHSSRYSKAFHAPTVQPHSEKGHGTETETKHSFPADTQDQVQTASLGPKVSMTEWKHPDQSLNHHILLTPGPASAPQPKLFPASARHTDWSRLRTLRSQVDMCMPLLFPSLSSCPPLAWGTAGSSSVPQLLSPELANKTVHQNYLRILCHYYDCVYT